MVLQGQILLILFAPPMYSRLWLVSFFVSLQYWRRMKDIKYAPNRPIHILATSSTSNDDYSQKPSFSAFETLCHDISSKKYISYQFGDKRLFYSSSLIKQLTKGYLSIELGSIWKSMQTHWPTLTYYYLLQGLWDMLFYEKRKTLPQSGGKRLAFFGC